ncbi:MAG: hypothetical protein H7Z14_04410 [Anaerolineae bacterium]|nr:hypothetical protein [Phycisphaerae bacterium]
MRTEVAAVVGIRWDAFAAEHPNLARVIDQHLMVESAVSHLRADPAFQTAMTNARAVGAGTEFIVKLIDKYVTKWLTTLV